MELSSSSMKTSPPVWTSIWVFLKNIPGGTTSVCETALYIDIQPKNTQKLSKISQLAGCRCFKWGTDRMLTIERIGPYRCILLIELDSHLASGMYVKILVMDTIWTEVVRNCLSQIELVRTGLKPVRTSQKWLEPSGCYCSFSTKLLEKNFCWKWVGKHWDKHDFCWLKL